MEPIKTKVWGAGYSVAILLAIFLLGLAINEFKDVFNMQSPSPMSNIISVNGKGEAISIPDVATFSFSVTENAKTVAEAQGMASEKTNKVLAMLKENKIADKDIKTQSYSINPHYEYVDGPCTPVRCLAGKSTLSGYDVSQTVEVKIRDLEKAGTILDLVGGFEVQNVNGLSFSIDDIDTVKEQARADAIADAKAKAEKLADDLGVRLVRIVSFSDANDYPYPMAYGLGGDMMVKSVVSEQRVTPEIPQGEQKIVSQVSISYEIQ